MKKLLTAVVITGCAMMFFMALPANARLASNGVAPMPVNERLASNGLAPMPVNERIPANGLAPLPLNARLASNGLQATGLDFTHVGQKALGR